MNSPEPYDDLEADLLALGDLVDVPGPPPSDVAAAVRARLEPPSEAPTPSGPRRPGRRRARWKIVAAVVVAVLAVTAATPQGRAAVATILRFAGIEMAIGDTPPEPVTSRTPLPAERTVSRADLPELVDFTVKVPARLGEPQRITVADHGRLVSMLWPGGIRLDQFSGTVGPYFYKQLGPPGPDHVMMGAYDAWWVPGEHPLGYIRRQDGTHVPLRQAAPTLVWQQGTLNYRLEGAGDVDEAVAVATSLGG
ncbi:hypothetical protein FE391_16330 [Nonomuraea sp. KC401]|uniref:hypothetical protein n=1 Tax=unclassified Nonomuraea TaxID=2593643 RepID=UPI0010FF2DEE|nr:MULTISPECIES: hypothetical protein [unclassified Nonomuraea]NBE94633.1 hypothetical protein [Nonomuraea sp. K271]TLF72631.1 hypothetical protein FE391_16330 [Nonomuraea sp. KC401]